MKRLTSSIAAAVLLAAPLPVLAHGASNWKAVAWERNQDTPEGVRWASFVDVNSITRAGDIVSFKQAWRFMDDQNRPVTRRGALWDPVPAGSFRVVYDFVCRQR